MLYVWVNQLILCLLRKPYLLSVSLLYNYPPFIFDRLINPRPISSLLFQCYSLSLSLLISIFPPVTHRSWVLSRSVWSIYIVLNDLRLLGNKAMLFHKIELHMTGSYGFKLGNFHMYIYQVVTADLTWSAK